MSFRLVSSHGSVSDSAAVNMYASGVIRPNQAVDFLRTTGLGVGPTASTSTTTMVFGVALDYAQGASDTQVRVIRFNRGQLWEVDCANAASTGQIGLRHALSASDRGVIHNSSTDVSGSTGIFLAVGMSGLTTGSGKLLGEFVSGIVPTGQNQTTFI